MFSDSKSDTSKGNDPALVLGSSGPKPQGKTAPSVFSRDLVIQGNVMTEGDIEIEGTVEGDVCGSLLTVGETALVRGELSAEDVVVHGQVAGRLRGRKVRLAATAQVDGDIIHKSLAIEAGARFEGSVQRQEDPLAQSSSKIASIKDARTGTSSTAPVQKSATPGSGGPAGASKPQATGTSPSSQGPTNGSTPSSGSPAAG